MFGIFITVFAIVGFIIILLYIIKFIYNYFIQRNLQLLASQMNPPGSYMQNSGVACPDYWVNTGVDSNGNYICKNSFNIQTNTANNNACSATTMSFSPVESGYTWEYGNPNGLTSYSDTDKYNFATTQGTGASMSRCNWVNQCGPTPYVQGTWQGINDVCNNPPTS